MNSGRRAAAFIDRDGVINVERNYVCRPEDFELLPRAIDGLRRLSDHGYALVVVTNQAGIAKGLYDESAYQHLTSHMVGLLLANGVGLDGVYHCPHHPLGTIARYAVECDCRKPGPGMLLRAATELELDLSRSVIVGDKPSDIAAGLAAGVRWKVLVQSGHALPTDARLQADHVCADLAAAADWTCGRARKS